MEVIEVMSRFPKAIETNQWVAGPEFLQVGPERPLYEARKAQPKV